jgi:hypothetical protein
LPALPVVNAFSKSSWFSKTTVNFWLDTLLLVLLLALMWCGMVVRFAFPPLTSAQGWTLWGRDLTWWMDLQFGLISALALGVLVHVMLHWNWVCGVLASWLGKRRGGKVTWDDGVKTLYGVGLLIAICNILGLAIAAAMLGIRPS